MHYARLISLLLLLGSAVPLAGPEARASSEAGKAPAVKLRPGRYPLTFVTPNGSTGDELVWMGPMHLLSWSAEKPRSVVREPPKDRAARRYGSIRLGEPARTFVILLEESRGWGKGVGALYADTDADGDLAEERRIALPAMSRGLFGSSAPQYPVVSFQCRYGATRRAIPIRFHTPAGSRGTVHYQVAGCWTAAIETNKGPMKVAVVDNSGEARFGAGPAGPRAGAMLWLDLRLSGSRLLSYSPGAMQELGSAQLVGGRLYRITPSVSGDRLTVANYTGPAGALEATATDGRGRQARVDSLTLSGPAGSFAAQGGEMPRLPTGQYTVAQAEVSCGAGRGQASYTVQPKRPITIAAGRTTRLALGGLLKLRLQGTRMAPPAGPHPSAGLAPPTQLVLARGKKTEVKFELTDAQGAGVQPGGGSQKESSFQGILRTLKGQQVARMQFEFG